MERFVEIVDFVQIMSRRHGSTISDLEEVAYTYDWIDKDRFMESASWYGKHPYGAHFKGVI